MSRYQVVWTTLANTELKNIHSYIAEKAKSDVPADNVVGLILDKIETLTHSPNVFQEELFLKENGIDAKYLVMERYKIIYQIVETKVYITDVFNCAQHPSKMQTVR